MTLTDTCKCGSQFHAQGWISSNIVGSWVAWINAHAHCRGSNLEITMETG